MRKMKFIAEEFFRSIQKSLFKDLILMVIFSICFVMSVVMSSYYLDLGELYSDAANYNEDYVWYKVGIEDRDEFIDNMMTMEDFQNMIDYYEKVRNTEEHPLISVATHQAMTMKEKDVKNIFGKKSCKKFLSSDHPTSFPAIFANESQGSLLYELKSAQFDYKAYQLYGLKTEEGEGFTKENTTIQHSSDAIPVILGNEYKGIIPIGQMLNISISGTSYVYPVKVIGILENGCQVPAYGNIMQDMVCLDSYVIFPYGIQIRNKSTQTYEIERYAYLDMFAFENSAVQMNSKEEFKEVVALFRDLGQEFNLPPIQLNDASMGLNLLRKETDTSVRIMLILTIVLFCFCFYGFFVAFYDKIQCNSKVYGIYLMNGCSLAMIMIPCLIEIVVILFPSVLVCQYVFTYDNVGTGANIDVILRTSYGFVGVAFVIGATFFAFMMKGVDTERLIRKKD